MSSAVTVIIDPEFDAVCPGPTHEEIILLAQSLVEDGCRDPVRYWDNGDPAKVFPIVDGASRYRLCKDGIPMVRAQERYGLSPEAAAALNCRLKAVVCPVSPMAFRDRASAKDWIIRNQLGRRNISEQQKQHLRGQLRLDHAADNKLGAVPMSVEEVARATGVSNRTIYRDSEFAKAINRLDDSAPAVRGAALRGEISRKDAIVLAYASPATIDRLNDVPPENLPAEAAALSNSIVPPPIGRASRPLLDIEELERLDKAYGALVRAKSDALRACGGKSCAWAFSHHERLRFLLAGSDNPDGGRTPGVYDAILDWQREAQKQRGLA
jgi:hypothetical protein